MENSSCYPQHHAEACLTLGDACVEDHVSVKVRTSETGLCFEECITCDLNGNIDYEEHDLSKFKCSKCGEVTHLSSFEDPDEQECPTAVKPGSNHIRRSKLHYVLEEGLNAGHLYLERKDLYQRCYELLNDGFEREVVPLTDIQGALLVEHQEKAVYVERERVYLTQSRICEVQTAKRLVSILLSEPLKRIPDLDGEIAKTEAKLGQKLAPSQEKAVKLCLNEQCSII